MSVTIAYDPGYIHINSQTWVKLLDERQNVLSMSSYLRLKYIKLGEYLWIKQQAYFFISLKAGCVDFIETDDCSDHLYTVQ